MINTYELASNIDLLGTPRITASKGTYRTSDPRVQLRLRYYPGVTLISTEAEAEPLCVGGSKPHAVRHESAVRTQPGVQLRERRASKWDR